MCCCSFHTLKTIVLVCSRTAFKFSISSFDSFSQNMAAQFVSGEPSLDDVKTHVENLSMYPVDVHHFSETPSGPFRCLDLPLVDSPTGGFMTSGVDYITEVTTFPKAEIKQALVAKNIEDLPAPYGLTQSVVMTVNVDIAVIRQNNGNYSVLKSSTCRTKSKLTRRRTYATESAVLWTEWGAFALSRSVCITCSNSWVAFSAVIMFLGFGRRASPIWIGRRNGILALISLRRMVPGRTSRTSSFGGLLFKPRTKILPSTNGLLYLSRSPCAI